MGTRSTPQSPWLQRLSALVQQRPLVIIRFDRGEWAHLYELRRGVNEFTIARSHSMLEGVRVPAPCIVVGPEPPDPGSPDLDPFLSEPFEYSDHYAEHLHFGLITSRSAITTLELRIKIKRCVRINPLSEAGLLQLVSQQPHVGNLERRLRSRASIVQLSPKLGRHVIGRLASIETNHGPMRAVAELLFTPRTFRDAAALQEDAVRAALKAFGLGPDDQALSLQLFAGRETALARISIMEDSVIEHDARHLPGFDLVGSDITGRAVFTKDRERLEIFTANRRPLEHVFGVDLIYLNATRQNIVMLQYKMLEPERDDEETDWIYRPDANLESEIRRMQQFAADHPPGPHEYRLNPAVFYLKFVKRDGAITSGGIITPIDHFLKLREDPACHGPKGGLRVSYDGLAGRYLRQGAFLDLLHSGYIGAHAETTHHLKTLVEAVLAGDRAVVAAIQRAH